MTEYTEFKPKKEFDSTKLFKILPIIIIIVILFFVFSSRMFVTVGSGEAGVVYRTFGGGVDTKNTFDEGFHIIAPWDKLHIYEIRNRELLETMKVLSSNGLDIEVEASVWYYPDFKKLGTLHKHIGENYVDRIVRPAVRSAARSVIGRYTPEQIYSSKRDVIQNEIFEESKKLLNEKDVVLDRILVRDVTLPTTIKTAIERKLKQEQEALEYEFRLAKASKEAERQRIEAEGKAKANEILNASLSTNILKDKGIEATEKLAESENSKIVIIGNENGLPLILGND